MIVKEKGILFTSWSIPKIQDRTKTQTRRCQGLEEINKNPDKWELLGEGINKGYWRFEHKDRLDYRLVKCPYGEVGSTLYIKETWRIIGWWEGEPYYLEYRDSKKMEEPGDSSNYDEDKYSDYARQCDDDCIEAGIKAREDGCFEFNEGQVIPTRWRSSLFMPRFASRINLEITEIRAEKLQNISEEDAIAEGIQLFKVGLPPCISDIYATDWPNPILGDTARSAFRNLWISINGKKHPWDNNDWCWSISFRRIIGE